MEFKNKKVIIFDLDGTLIDSAADLAYAINAMLTKLQRPTASETLIYTWIGNGAATLVQRALSHSKTIDSTLDKALSQKALAIFLEFYRQNLCTRTRIYPKVKDTLIKLKEKGYYLTIVTNKPFKFVAPILEHLALNHLFELVLGADSLEEKKPHPLPLLHTCQAFNISVQESIMIGDSKNDILAAHACEMQSIAVSYGYNHDEDITIHQPSLVINDFSTLLEVL